MTVIKHQSAGIVELIKEPTSTADEPLNPAFVLIFCCSQCCCSVCMQTSKWRRKSRHKIVHEKANMTRLSSSIAYSRKSRLFTRGLMRNIISLLSDECRRWGITKNGVLRTRAAFMSIISAHCLKSALFCCSDTCLIKFSSMYLSLIANFNMAEDIVDSINVSFNIFSLWRITR